MQHVEEAGIHSGDSACVLPPHSLGSEMLGEIREATRRIALALGTVGLINVQYGVLGDDLYVIEANPRASRTVPFVSKATGLPLAKLACRVMLGEKPRLAEPARGSRRRPRLRQGGRAPVRPLRRRRRPARARDALDRRGDGRGARLPGRLRQGPGRGRRAAAAGRHRLPHGHRHRQVGGDGDRRPAARPRLPDRRHARDRRLDLADGDPGRADQQDRRGLAARRRLDRRRRGRPRHQHARPAPPPAPTATRSAAPPSPAGSRASRRSRAGWRPAARSPRRGRASRPCCRCRSCTPTATPRCARPRDESKPRIEGGRGGGWGCSWVVCDPQTTPRAPTAERSRRSLAALPSWCCAGTMGRTWSSPWPIPRARPRTPASSTCSRRPSDGAGRRRAPVPAAGLQRDASAATASSTSCSRTSAPAPTVWRSSAARRRAAASSARSARASRARATGGARSSSAAASASRRWRSGATRSAPPRSRCSASATPPTPRAPR